MARQPKSPLLACLPVAVLLTACASGPPDRPGNLCEIYRENPGWYADSMDAARRWDGPLDVPMAIMAQESGFRARARPPMRYFLGFIPYGRGSDAYGYPQALDSTWSVYRQEAGSLFSQRDDFTDAVDFIQWYMHRSWRLNGVAKDDAFAQYLNYHEGQGGYRRGSWHNKGWLIQVARRVERRAETYRSQLAVCQAELEKARRWRFW